MRVAVVATVVVGGLLLGGCGSSSGDDVSTPSVSAPVTSAASSSSVPSTAGSSAASSGAATSAVPTGTPAPGTGVWTLTRSRSASTAGQVTSLRCGQDGSVTAPGLTVAPGGTSFTLADPPVTVAGTAQIDAAGGIFRGRGADGGVVFTWTC